MTQEDKELLLKDLAARLPYGVICYDEAQNETGIFKQFEYEGFGRIHNGRGMRYIEHIHPILRPMSSMTEEEEKEFIKILDLEMEALSAPEGHTIASAASSTFEIDFYNKHHFDYRGLIEKGLAIEVTKENNPYKN